MKGELNVGFKQTKGDAGTKYLYKLKTALGVIVKNDYVVIYKNNTNYKEYVFNVTGQEKYLQHITKDNNLDTESNLYTIWYVE